MRTIRIAVGVLVALVVAAMGGWLWGAYGKAAADRAVETSALRMDLVEGRSSVLSARLDLYSLNFGEAGRHLNEARTQLRRAGSRFEKASREDDIKRLQPVFAQLDEAQRLAGQMDQNANARAADAAKTVADVLQAQ